MSETAKTAKYKKKIKVRTLEGLGVIKSIIKYARLQITNVRFWISRISWNVILPLVKIT